MCGAGGDALVEPPETAVICKPLLTKGAAKVARGAKLTADTIFGVFIASKVIVVASCSDDSIVVGGNN